jgi:hypothetical protein
MDETVVEPAEQPSRRRGIVTPRRIAAAVGLLVLVFSLRRHLRFLRDVVRHRRRLKLAFTLLVLLRQLRRR